VSARGRQNLAPNPGTGKLFPTGKYRTEFATSVLNQNADCAESAAFEHRSSLSVDVSATGGLIGLVQTPN
jgi:hypothetical protein